VRKRLRLADRDLARPDEPGGGIAEHHRTHAAGMTESNDGVNCKRRKRKEAAQWRGVTVHPIVSRQVHGNELVLVSAKPTWTSERSFPDASVSPRL
jgi:copper oxidase (laccase) domain-containing protein